MFFLLFIFLPGFIFAQEHDGLILSGELKTGGIVTHSFKLKDFAEAFEICMDGKNSIKVMLEP